MKNILQHIITKDCYKNKINNQEEIDSLRKEMIEKYEIGNYSFKDKIKYNLFTQKKKKRTIAQIINVNNGNSVDSRLEYYLSKSLNKLVTTKTKLLFANRNKILLGLFNTLKSINNFVDYTIIRFDFSKYFDSISSLYVYNKYLDILDFTKEQKCCLKQYVSSIKYCTAGLPLSNTFAEIIGQAFDFEIKKTFSGILYYARYVDDGILIVNQKLSCDNAKNLLNKIIETVFYDKSIPGYEHNKTKIDYNKKFNCITYDDRNRSFDYLGYLINLTYINNKLDVELGITSQKRNKYCNKTKNLIKEYSNNPEKLRIILKLFSRRIVYTILKNNDVKRWISKGLIYNYKDLFFFGDDIDHNTKIFLRSLYNKCFAELQIDIPYYLKDPKSSCGYNLFYCLQHNKTFILDKNIGIKEDDLNSLLEIVSPEYDLKNKKYHEKVKQLLIECKIGY